MRVYIYAILLGLCLDYAFLALAFGWNPRLWQSEIRRQQSIIVETHRQECRRMLEIPYVPSTS